MNNLISRQDAIDAVHEEFDEVLVWDESGKRTADEFEDIIVRVPSAQPETSPKISEILDYLDTTLHPLVSPEHYDVYSTLHDMISLLGLERPQRTGRWIEDDEGYFYCDQCGKYPAYQITQSDCCPNCGADMRTPVEIARNIVHEAIDNSVWSDTVDTAKMHKVVDDKYAEMTEDKA